MQLPAGQRFLERSPDPYCILDLKTARIKWLNASCAFMLKYDREELLDRSFLDLLHPDDRRQALDTSLSLRCRCRDGSYRTVMWDFQADDETSMLYASGRDVTEVMALEEQLNQSQKMEAIARVAGGIAHGFNNVLSVILGLGELAKEKFPAEHFVQADLDDILVAGARARGLTQQLLAFSRNQVLSPQAVDLNDALLRQVKMLRQTLGDNIELKIEPATDLAPMLVDPDQLHLVLMGLAVNARDAMPKGGVLTMETGMADAEEVLISGYFGAVGEGLVRLVVRDNGVGMSPEVRAHVFEPFFTTKTKAPGAGLGLATVFGIVKQSRGHLRLDSEPGRGTAFTLYFPIAPSDAPSPASQARGLAAGEVPTVLLAEDEPMLRRLARIGLERADFRVLQASNGEEAVKVAADFEDPIHLMITDVLMPHLNGPEAARKIQATRPEMKVLYISGYSDGALLDQEPGTVELLGKPFQPKELVARVQSILGRSAPL